MTDTTLKGKFYKLIIISKVNMIPSDPTGSLDEFFLLGSFRWGSF